MVQLKSVSVCSDIKPSNVLVNTQGCVKLCDFGVSVQLLTSLTKTFIGTNAYMAVSHLTKALKSCDQARKSCD